MTDRRPRKLKIALAHNVRPPENERTQAPLADDRFAEWDSPETIAAIARVLEDHHDVTPIELNAEAYENLRNLRPELVFNMAEGLEGPAREGILPSLLDLLHIPYTGPSATTLNLCLHKARANEVLAYHGIPVPQHRILTTVPASLDAFALPAVVKPLYEGSSKGVRDSSFVQSLAELQHEVQRILDTYHQPALVEPFLAGREFTVALLGNPPALEVLPIVEIRLDQLPETANPLYSYEAKWLWDVPEQPLPIFDCPARIEDSLRGRIEDICRRTFEILECADWCRIDMRLDQTGTPHVLEVNPLPGILPNPAENSCFPKAARTKGLSFEEIVHRVVANACERHGIC